MASRRKYQRYWRILSSLKAVTKADGDGVEGAWAGIGEGGEWCADSKSAVYTL